jgi:hypothetical protein
MEDLQERFEKAIMGVVNEYMEEVPYEEQNIHLQVPKMLRALEEAHDRTRNGITLLAITVLLNHVLPSQ